MPDLRIPAWISSSSLWQPEYICESGWLEHAPFAFWLIDAALPRTFVELGTHSGYSFFAFCQAVEALGLGTRCYAVDTWKGDEHAGFYGEDIFSRVKEYHTGRYAGFSHLVRATFDEAASRFQDGTIDLLHIDGRHFYDDVRHDFSTWRPKLSTRGIVVLHDINVRERGFGVWKLWKELKTKYPFFEFNHGHGLGVIAVGAEIPEGTRSLFEANIKNQRLTRSFFSRLGGTISDRWNLRVQHAQINNLSSELGARANEVEALKVALVDREKRAAALDHALTASPCLTGGKSKDVSRMDGIGSHIWLKI